MLKQLAIALPLLLASQPAHSKVFDKNTNIAGMNLYYKVILPTDYDPAKPYPAVLAFLKGRIDNNLAISFDNGPETAIALRARGRVVVISEALSTHGSYFDARATA